MISRDFVELLQVFSHSARPFFSLALFMITPLRVIRIAENFTPGPIQGRRFCSAAGRPCLPYDPYDAGNHRNYDDDFHGRIILLVCD